jgi:hypothetical protein
MPCKTPFLSSFQVGFHGFDDLYFFVIQLCRHSRLHVPIARRSGMGIPVGREGCGVPSGGRSVQPFLGHRTPTKRIAYKKSRPDEDGF